MNIKRYSLLVVDDDAHLRTALSRWFTMRGFQVDTAENGEEALEQCASRRYDVITMDLVMPGIDGAETASRIRTMHPDVPIIMLSGYAGDAERLHEAGFLEVLQKPIRMLELERKVRLAVTESILEIGNG
ncbi:MAG TPA: response regulator [Candidatus Hydrogenedentes bacterium]|mgnify:CR=1 FL=1|nr:response regulator [Candidatus Hydrogenedentota bacterium]